MSTLYELRTLPLCPRQTVYVPCASSGRVVHFASCRGNPACGPYGGQYSGPFDLGARWLLTAGEIDDVAAFVAARYALVNNDGVGMPTGIYTASEIRAGFESRFEALAGFVSSSAV